MKGDISTIRSMMLLSEYLLLFFFMSSWTESLGRIRRKAQAADTSPLATCRSRILTSKDSVSLLN